MSENEQPMTWKCRSCGALGTDAGHKPGCPEPSNYPFNLIHRDVDQSESVITTDPTPARRVELIAMLERELARHRLVLYGTSNLSDDQIRGIVTALDRPAPESVITAGELVTFEDGPAK